MSEIVPFSFDEHRVRVIVDFDGNPWWVAADVCAVLGYRNAPDAVRQHVRPGQRSDIAIHDGRQNRRMVAINEGGLYRLIMRSELEAAERFQDWVTDEVLPQIRRTGSYSAAPAIPALPQTYADALRALAEQVEARELADSRVAELEPAAEQFHRWQLSEDTVNVVEWAKTIGLAQNEAFKALRELGVLFKQQHDDRGSRVAFNVPKRGWEQYFDLVDEYLPGPKRWVKTPRITAEGQVVLTELLIEHGWIAP